MRRFLGKSLYRKSYFAMGGLFRKGEKGGTWENNKGGNSMERKGYGFNRKRERKHMSKVLSRSSKELDKES